MSHVPCKFYKQGTCTAGANCTFSHSSDLSSESAVCKYFVKGNCKFGTKCALLHTMSPYGNMKPPSLSFTGRRKTTTDNSIDHRSFLNDPFASSAPAVSLFQGEHLWRTQPRTQMIGVRSSPRESDQFQQNSPLFNYRQQQQQSSSLRSGYFNNQPQPFAYPVGSSSSIDDYHGQQQQNGYDLNDAMLPSSLNDLFTPNELHARSLRQQSTAPPSSFESPWRIPSSFGETAAINIPCGNNMTSGSSGTSSGSYLQGHQNDDDEFQFFMEDDEAVTFDHMNTKPSTNNPNHTPYTMPSLISLPST